MKELLGYGVVEVDEETGKMYIVFKKNLSPGFVMREVNLTDQDVLGKMNEVVGGKVKMLDVEFGLFGIFE